MKTRYALLRDLFIFFFIMFFVILVWKNNIAVTAIILGFYFLRYILWPNREDHIIFIAGAILGSTAEIIATHAGVWNYTLPTFLNIPIWLPFAWGFVSVLIIRVAQCVKR
jgi:uncharacterized membrane protein